MRYEHEIAERLMYSECDDEAVKSFRSSTEKDGLFNRYYEDVVKVLAEDDKEAVNALLELLTSQEQDIHDRAFAEGLYIGLGLCRLCENPLDVYNELLSGRDENRLYSGEIEMLENFIKAREGAAE